MRDRPPREREELRREQGAEEAPQLPAAELLALQRTAGNAAVARAVIARQGGAVPTGLGMRGGGGAGVPNLFPPLGGGVDMKMLEGLQQRQEEIKQIILRWIEPNRPRIQGQVLTGMSLPEVVDMIRSAVPEAAELASEQIGAIAQQAMGGVQIPAHRLEHVEREFAAQLKNALRNVPTSLSVGREGGRLSISFSGLEAEARAGATTVKAGATPGGGEASVSHRDVEVGAEGSWSDKTVGLTTKVGPIAFGAEIKVGNGGSISSWQVGIGIGNAGALGPLIPSTQKAVRSAADAVGEVAGHLRRGGKPTDSFVTDRLKTIREGFAPLQTIAAATGPTAGVTLSGEGGEIRVEASITIPF
jgi:hypothetical protein